MALLALIALLLRAHQQLETLCFVTVLKHISLVSGALTCDLLLSILSPPFGYFVLIFCGVGILVRALLGSYQQILGRLLDVAAIAAIARDLQILHVFHGSSPQEAHNQAYSMVSQSMKIVSTNHNSTDQGGRDHATTEIVSV
ncbi:unnamed protein product [Dovyalis caffra]|uniref:Uncharacterized protein n=1 Tax=Dovyalis caffra TaxID=77055 RepID=A0AAV1SWB8_9ROSI|nr:unnamed protein product [Dovyalis caffra]